MTTGHDFESATSRQRAAESFPLRTLGYSSVAARPFATSEINDLVEKAKTRNVEFGITGRLFLIDNRFIQVIEGERDRIGVLFSLIQTDRRHFRVTKLWDHEGVARSFPDWQVVLGETMVPSGRADLRRGLREVEVSGVAGGPAGERIKQMVTGPERANSRVLPRQPRSQATYDRLLRAVEEIVRAEGVKGLTLGSVARKAGVTPQSGYRYFSDIDSLLRVMVGRIQSRYQARFLTQMLERRFASERELATAIVGFIVQAHHDWAQLPDPVSLSILRRFHDLDFDAAWELAAALVQSLRQSGNAFSNLDVTVLASALTGIAAIGKSLALRDPLLPQQPRIQLMMEEMLLGVLRNGNRAML